MSLDIYWERQVRAKGKNFSTSGFKIPLRANFDHFAKKFLAKRSVKIGSEAVRAKACKICMKLVFVCPENNKVFETDAFNVIEDKGVKFDDSGNKFWDAKVELTSACPFCGNRHVFDVSELPCPFT